MQHGEPSASPSRGRSLIPRTPTHSPDRPTTSSNTRSRSRATPRRTRSHRSRSPQNRRRLSTTLSEDFEFWRQHDMLLVSNRNLAQELQGHIDRLKSRFEDDQLNTMSRLKFYSIEEKIKELSSANHLIQKTWNLYYWIRDEGKAKRTESPMDTLPASESMYAFAIGVKGDLPVSPLRGLDSLNRMLKDKWRIVAKLDPQEKMGAPPKDSISVNF